MNCVPKPIADISSLPGSKFSPAIVLKSDISFIKKHKEIIIRISSQQAVAKSRPKPQRDFKSLTGQL